MTELEPANHTLYAFLGGGQGNFIDVGGKWNVITGGDNNFNGGWHASIVGGHKNEIGRLNSYYGFLGGGDSNIIGTRTGWGTLSGGRTNYIGRPGNGYPTPAEDLIYGTIAGGDTNRVFSNYGSIGGGSQNEIRNNGSTSNGGAFAAIPGGRGLVAKSYAQLVAGRFSLPLGTSTESTILPNDPLVIVGNGANSTSPSNAFEISNNGHSIVFHANGTGGTGGTPAIVGGTYVDNVILAWGVVTAGAPPVVTADFGIQSVTNTVSNGVFKVELNVTDAHNPLVQHMIDQASITVTVIDDDEPVEGVSGVCGYATASRIRTTLPIPGNPPAPHPYFYVRTYSGQQTGTVSDGVVQLDCAPQTKDFMFKVTGRKQ